MREGRAGILAVCVLNRLSHSAAARLLAARCSRAPLRSRRCRCDSFEGKVLVISHAKHVKFAAGGGKVVLRDGDGRLELTSDVAEPFQLSLQARTVLGQQALHT